MNTQTSIRAGEGPSSAPTAARAPFERRVAMTTHTSVRAGNGGIIDPNGAPQG